MNTSSIGFISQNRRIVGNTLNYLIGNPQHLIATLFINVSLSATSQLYLYSPFWAPNFPRISIAQPVVSHFHLPPGANLLVKNSILVTNAVTNQPRIGIAIAPNAKQRIFRGECLLLTRDLPTTNNSTCFQANCTIPKVLDQLEVGASVWIDDGHIGAKVESITEEGVLLRIVHARFKGEKIGTNKGLNFPDTILRFSPLTQKDRQDLDFVATHADIIGYSFVQEPADIELLQRELQARLPANASIPGIIAKIETPLAVCNLPELIVQAAGKQPFGIMIARGDLAVEIGYQRLAEIQEEILWLCEAAHVPVIWATQVMENLVKHGIPSRAEITDAVMAERAECVMLNKGAYIAEAVTILDDVLIRMQAHQVKKTPQLRALHSW